ncbi:MAG: hypothetical protein NVS3B3_20730 [Aquirhabdus sp.]
MNIAANLAFSAAYLLQEKTKILLNFMLIVLAFALFGLGLSLQRAFDHGSIKTGSEQLLVANKTSQGLLLPMKIAQIVRGWPEIQAVSHATWFAGYYREPQNPVPLLAVDAMSHFDANPAWHVESSALRTWQTTRNGLMIERRLAQKAGITIGQRFNLYSYLWRQSDGSNEWDFVVSGLYDADSESGGMPAMFMHYEYLNEARMTAKDLVNVILIQLRSAKSMHLVAQRIDAMQANSEFETKTSSSAVLAENYFKQVLRINSLLFPLVGLVFLTTLLVGASTIANNMRQRMGELSVLKSLGYSNAKLFQLISTEIGMLFFAGSVLGLGLVQVGLWLGRDLYVAYFPALQLEFGTWLIGFGIAIAFVLVCCAAPFYHIRKLDPTSYLQG